MSIRRRRSWLSALALAAIMAGTGSLAGPVSAAEFQFRARPWMRLASQAEQFLPFMEDAARIAAGSNALTYNGKLTVLLLGSDWRQSSGERLDTIMVVSIDTAKNIKAISIPRDSARIPLYTGGTYHGKINGMFKYFKNLAGTRNGALDRFRLEVAYLIGAKIDYVAFVRFGGFDALVDAVDHVTVNIPYELRDPSFIDKPGWPTGAKFLADSSANLGGGNDARCYGGHPKPVTNWGPVINCTRALVYVRSRHGKLVGCCGNNDYKRAARQQKFVFEAIKRVTDGFGGVPSSLRSAYNSHPNDIYTTIPSSSDAQLWTKLNGSHFSGNNSDSKVFSPPTYANHIHGTSANQLNLTAIRNLCNSWFDDV